MSDRDDPHVTFLEPRPPDVTGGVGAASLLATKVGRPATASFHAIGLLNDLRTFEQEYAWSS